MKNVIRAKSELKLATSEGFNVTYEFAKGTDPWEIVKHMVYAHAANVGLQKCSQDLLEYIKTFESTKAVEAI